MGWLSGVVVAVVLGGSGATSTPPPQQHAAPTFGTQSCQKKRVDACGCHHVYGVRHCHPNRKSNHCEVIAQAETVPVDFPTYLASLDD